MWKTLLRPITEYVCPLWHSGLSDAGREHIESLQKKVLGMILGTFYIEHKRYYNVNGNPVNYKNTIKEYGLTTLHQRREVLTQKFAIETAKSSIHKNFFELKLKTGINTRKTFVIQEKVCSTEIYYYSAIPYMSRILNNVYIMEKRNKEQNALKCKQFNCANIESN